MINALKSLKKQKRQRNKMGESSSKEVVKKLLNALTTEPRNIGVVAEESGVNRASASEWLGTLAETGVIKEKDLGRETLYWRYTLSDRMTGLELRGMDYDLQRIHSRLEEVLEANHALIEKSNDDTVLDGEEVE